jgi:hypothetical protein
LSKTTISVSAGRRANAKNLHCPVTEADDLDEILAWREERMVKVTASPDL